MQKELLKFLFHSKTAKIKKISEIFASNLSYVQMPHLISSGDNDFSIFQVQMNFANANSI